MSSLWPTLCAPEPYRAAIDRVLDRAGRDGSLEIAGLRAERGSLARRLAREVAARAWRQDPFARRMVVLDRPRELVRLTALDRVVHSAFATALGAGLESSLPDSLFSYRSRRGPTRVIDEVRRMLRAYHTRGLPVRERGLFVLRLDVERYSDSVRVDDDSELWPMLRACFPDEDPWLASLLRDMIRGQPDRRIGLPTGSPLANPLLNLYLVDLDRELDALATLCVRYGDDYLVICDDAATAALARSTIEATLARKQLRINDAKLMQTYWSGPGRPGPPGWAGASHVAYVGLELDFHACVRLKTTRRRTVLRAVRERIWNLARFAPAALDTDDDVRRRAAMLCAGLRAAYDPCSPFVLPELPAALASSSCRKQLAEMDREIAIAVAAAATDRSGPAAFRRLPWRSLYELGLPSLVRLRNRGAS